MSKAWLPWRASSPSIFSTGCYPRHPCRDENAEIPRFREPRGTCSEPGEVDVRHDGEHRQADSWTVVEIGLVLAERCEPILLSKAQGQSIPPAPPLWRIVDDDEPEGGPLAAMMTACRSLDDAAFAGVFVATCDQAPEALRESASALLEGFAVDGKSRIFFDGERRQPFPGYYSASALRSIAEKRARGITSMHAFLDSLGDEIELVPTSRPPADWDDPQAYLAAASAAGFDPPAWCREALLRRSGIA